MKLNTRPLMAALLCLGMSNPSYAADSDLDGVEDNADNCTLTINVSQRDTDQDGFGNDCDADFNNDNITDFSDLGVMKANFFSTTNEDTDLNGDGTTDFLDLGMMKQMFFGLPGPTGNHPDIPNCTCYFSSDCASGQFCDWGPDGPFTEDGCWWRTPKPEQIPGQGCDTEYEGEPGPICDGYCTAASAGSSIGHEDPATVVAGIGLWAEAMLTPSLAGGGPVDPLLAAQATALPFDANDNAMVLGRHTADLLTTAGGSGFYDYFCHFESYPNEPDRFVDLSTDACRGEAAGIAVAALRAEIQKPGSATALVGEIPQHCSNWQTMFAPRCAAGPTALNCFAELVGDMAVLLTTPRNAAPSHDSFLDRLRGRAD